MGLSLGFVVWDDEDPVRRVSRRGTAFVIRGEEGGRGFADGSFHVEWEQISAPKLEPADAAISGEVNTLGESD